MILLEVLTALYTPLFTNGAVWTDVMPEGTTVGQRQAPFLIMQQISGDTSWYVGYDPVEDEYARVQHFIWGTMRREVDLAMEMVKENLRQLAMTDPRFVAIKPEGGISHEYDPILKLRGARMDFGFWFNIASP